PLFDGKHGVWCPSILGMVSVLAPTLGPTVGGVITEAVDWRWIFFINVGPGAAVTVLAIILIYVDGAEPSMFKRIDWLHLLAMAVFLGGLEVVRRKGRARIGSATLRFKSAPGCRSLPSCCSSSDPFSPAR